MDDCTPSSCDHGQCIDEHQDVQCVCENGYTGKIAIHHHVSIDSVYIDEHQDVWCVCEDGYTG